MRKKCKINLALQGGGSYGAFTWGVLDRLLEEEHINFEGISGTSSGALNAAVLITALEQHGREAARTALENFWMDISHSNSGFNFVRLAAKMFKGLWPMPHYLASMALLQELIKKHVSFEAIRKSEIKLFVSATNIKTGAAKIFHEDALYIEALLASACLPQIFQPIKIDDEYYWDGGYSSNPALWPIVNSCDTKDTLLVQLNSDENDCIPRTQDGISNRLLDITFNAVLMEELRAIDAANLGIYIHKITIPAEVQNLPNMSRLNANSNLILQLKNLGRRAAENWLASERLIRREEHLTDHVS